MRVAIIGATSAIAREVATLYAAEGATLFLVARNEASLLALAGDLRARGATGVETFLADLTDRTRDHALLAAAGTPEIVLIAHGTLPDQRAIEHDVAALTDAFTLNATSTITLAAHFANVLEHAGRGTLAVIGSIAGDRGRRTNHLYGAAKAAVHTYCEGLRGRLLASNVAVVLVKPGWVDTPMTAGIRKNALFASAASVGRGIHAAIRARRGTVYVPGYWRWISLIVRILPARFVKF